jgi:hypothetical protein
MGGVLTMQTDWERLRDAVIVLAGAGPVKQRLLDACQRHLRDLDPGGLPRELRGTYASLLEALQSAQRAGSLDTVAASVRKMSDMEAARHAQAVVQLFAGLNETQGQTRPASPLRAVPDDDEIPAFLNRA